MKKAALFTLLLFSACGGSSPTGPTALNYSGTWRGSTSQGLPITITVAGDMVSAVDLQIRVSMAGASCTSAFKANATAQIANASFSMPITSTSGVSYSSTLEGTFASATSLSGRIRSFSANGLLCSGVFVIGTPVSQSERTFTANKS